MEQAQPENESVLRHQNVTKLDHKMKNKTPRSFIKLLDLFKELLYVRKEKARGNNVMIFIS